MGTIDESFLRGTQYVNGKKQQHRNNERQSTLDAMAKETHQSNLERNNLRNQASRAELDEFNATKEDRSTLRALQLENAQGQKDERTYKTERNKVLDTREDELFQKQKEQASEAEKMKWLQENSEIEYYKAATGKAISPEYYEKSKGTTFDLTRVLDSKSRESIEFLSAAMNPDDKRVAASDPRFIPAFNNAFDVELKKNLAGSVNPETGSPAIDKKLIGVFPAEGPDGKPVPGEFYGRVRVFYEDGSHADKPLTESRGNAPGDPLKRINMGDFIGQVGARQAYNRAWSKPNVVEQIKEYFQYKDNRGKKTKAPDYKEKTEWNGQIITADQVQKMFHENEQATRFADDGVTQLYTLEDYKWTKGDPERLTIMRQVGNINRSIVANNRLLEEEGKPPAPLVNVRQIYAKEVQNRQGKGKGAIDPNDPLFQELMKDEGGQGGQAQPSNNPESAPSPAPDLNGIDPEDGPEELMTQVKTGRPGHYNYTEKAVPKYVMRSKPGMYGRSRPTEKVLNPEYVELLQQQQQQAAQ